MKIYHVYLAFDKPIIAFRYPPIDKCVLEENEIAMGEPNLGIYVMIGTSTDEPYFWINKEAAQNIADKLKGYVESSTL